MSGPIDLEALLAGGELDAETIKNLQHADLDEMRALLLQYFPDSEVDGMIERIRRLRDLSTQPPPA